MGQTRSFLAVGLLAASLAFTLGAPAPDSATDDAGHLSDAVHCSRMPGDACVRLLPAEHSDSRRVTAEAGDSRSNDCVAFYGVASL